MHLGADWLAADGRLPLWAVATARDAEGKPADVEGGVVLEADNANVYQPVAHPAPGLYRFAVVAAPNRGQSRATLRLKGKLTAEASVPIGSDRFDALGGIEAGGCGFSRGGSSFGAFAIALVTFLGRSRSRSRAAAPAAPSIATGAPDRPR
jgi:hypothetical protein